MRWQLLFAAAFVALGFGVGWVAGQGHGADLCLADHTPALQRAWQALEDCRAEQRYDAIPLEQAGEIVGVSSSVVHMLGRTRARDAPVPAGPMTGAWIQTTPARSPAIDIAMVAPVGVPSKAVHPTAQPTQGALAAPGRLPR